MRRRGTISTGKIVLLLEQRKLSPEELRPIKKSWGQGLSRSFWRIERLITNNAYDGYESEAEGFDRVDQWLAENGQCWGTPWVEEGE